MQEEREDPKLESDAIRVMKETPASTRIHDQGGLVENTEAVAFETYVGITLSKPNWRKFCQAKKGIGNILYNIEESDDASSSNTPVYDQQFEQQKKNKKELTKAIFLCWDLMLSCLKIKY